MDADLGLTKLLGGLWQDAEELASRALDRHVRIAVTGLRRSGKTVFITSMVQALLTGQGLPFVRAVHEGRYLGAKLLPVDGPAFPFEQFCQDLSQDPPLWPNATETLTKLKLEIRRQSEANLSSYVQPVQPLTVEIIDYPGEWLLDLPLLTMDFAKFSAAALKLAQSPVRRDVAADWLNLVEELDDTSDEAALERVNMAFKSYLTACQQELGLWHIQPGRFVHPGDLTDLSVLAFSPLPASAPASLTTIMQRRFERYKREVVTAFYDDHFQGFDRQIVMIDLLGLLNAGPAHFEDAQTSLAGIMESFRYGRDSLFSRLFSPAIDRVVFAVSKADHVAGNQHPNLKQLMELMIAQAARNHRFEGITHEVLALASLRSTDTVRTEHQGQMLSCVRGRLKNEARETVLFPGEIPPELPDDEDWRSGRFKFFEFAPRPLATDMTNRHIRLDQAIEHLIGDKLG